MGGWKEQGAVMGGSNGWGAAHSKHLHRPGPPPAGSWRGRSRQRTHLPSSPCPPTPSFHPQDLGARFAIRADKLLLSVVATLQQQRTAQRCPHQCAPVPEALQKELAGALVCARVLARVEPKYEGAETKVVEHVRVCVTQPS